MPRPLPFADRRLAEEAVRQGLVAAVVMEAAAREWTAAEDDEVFPAYLVRREILKEEQLAALAASLEGETEEAPAPGGAGEGGPEKAPHPSEVVKGYRILERLGRGGMGSVYRAEQQGMNRVVALKILRRPFGESEEHVERLKREARLVGALDHPNIVRGLDVGSHGPYHYFAMEFVEGDTLRELLRKRGVCPEAEALRIVEGICQALDHAHSRGVVHRDVKPGNVIITPDGTPKLTDYGLAKGPTDFTLTQSGVTIGTPQYISPEQAREPAGVDIQTDLYSLGATAYHMLTGVPPHSSDTLAGLLTKVLYEKPRTAKQVNPRVSAGASFLVEKMMAKQRKHRYRTPRDVLSDLRALAAGKSIVPRDWAGDFEVHEVRRKYRMAVMGGAAVVASVAIAAVILQYNAQQQIQKAKEGDAQSTYTSLVGGAIPRTKLEWETRVEALEGFVRSPDFLGTPAIKTAEGELPVAQEHLRLWEEAEAHVGRAEEQRRARKHNDAVAYLEQSADGLLKKGGAKGRLPAEWLRRRAETIREEGRKEAARAIERARADAERIPPAEFALNEVQRQLQEARDRAYETFVAEPEKTPAIQELDEVLARLRDVRAEVEVSCLGEDYRKRRDGAIRKGEFRAVEDELDDVERRIAGNARLQSVLEQVPAPAAADARARTDRERERLGVANRTALDGLVARAREADEARDFDRALEILDGAERTSIRDLQPEVRGAREAVEKRKEQVREEGERAVRNFWEGILQDFSRRDLLGATRRLSAPGPVATGRSYPEAVGAALFLVERVEEAVFDPVRKRIQDGGAFPRGLQFEDRLLHTDVRNVRLRETETGPVIVFDAGNQTGITGGLYRLSLELLLEYAGLKGEGLSAGQALARATLLLAEGESRERREIEAQASLLRRIRDTLPPVAVPGVDVLLGRVDVLVAAKMRTEANLDKIARETHEAVLVALEGKDPRTALRNLDLLLGAGQPLNGTRYVNENRDMLKIHRASANAMADDQELEDYYKGFVVERAAGGTEADTLTRMRCFFEDDACMKSFRAPDDGGPRLYRVVKDAGGNGSGGGHLVFLDGDADRGPSETPVVIECPFKPSRFIGVSFRYRSERPLYLQVSVVGSHIGVLTDDGRKTSGRGVFAWQGEWDDADRYFPFVYRHDSVAKVPDPAKFRDNNGLRYFQFEAGVVYAVRVEWDKSRLRLQVDGREIWNVELDRGRYDSPPRIRILTCTSGWIDDLVLEGVVDRPWFEKLRRGGR